MREGLKSVSQPVDYDGPLGVIRNLIPTYSGGSLRNAFFSFTWDEAQVNDILDISRPRALKRIATYVIPTELPRIAKLLEDQPKRGASMRFGLKKLGRGISHENGRGDFCLVGGVIERRTFTAFYRSVDLLGGFLYDLAIFQHVFNELSLKPRVVNIFAVKCGVAALRGNSNEALHAKIMKLIEAKYADVS